MQFEHYPALNISLQRDKHQGFDVGVLLLPTSSKKQGYREIEPSTLYRVRAAHGRGVATHPIMPKSVVSSTPGKVCTQGY
jgi:hypothetical protein